MKFFMLLLLMMIMINTFDQFFCRPLKQDSRDIEIMMVKGFELSSFSLLIIGFL